MSTELAVRNLAERSRPKVVGVSLSRTLSKGAEITASPRNNRNEIGPTWLWRQAKGPPLRLAQMETSHLFYTLRMIWNNTMPAEARVGEVKLYRFPNHSPAYLREAAKRMLEELMERSDVPEWAASQVNQMGMWFYRPRAITKEAGWEQITYSRCSRKTRPSSI